MHTTYVMTKMPWVPLSILAATLYGSFSFMLSFVDPKIKKSESAQFGYGTLLVIVSGVLGTMIHLVWRMMISRQPLSLTSTSAGG